MGWKIWYICGNGIVVEMRWCVPFINYGFLKLFDQVKKCKVAHDLRHICKNNF